MWTAKKTFIDGKQTHKFSILESDRLLTYSEVIQLWRTEPEFIRFYISLLKDSSFDAYFWETPPITEKNINKNFEFVLVETSYLAGMDANGAPFQKQFDLSFDEVLTFENLGGDAVLVVPRAMSGSADYSSLAKYSRTEKPEYQIMFWKRVGDAIHDNLGAKKLWVSTSGLGVFWLHVRLDQRPKYYTYEAYKK